MRPQYDEFDEYEFADSSAVRRLLREQQRERRRQASRRSYDIREEDFLDDPDSSEDYRELNFNH
jgi:hypothetical protein